MKKEKRRKNSWQIASETYHPKVGVARRVDVCDMGAKLGLFEMKKLEAMQCIAHFPYKCIYMYNPHSWRKKIKGNGDFIL